MAQIIVALDLPSSSSALGLVEELGEEVSIYKVGSPLFARSGPLIVRELRSRRKRVFLDLKYHDIPSTVARAVEAAATLDVTLLTLHTSGGLEMMRAAREAVGSDGPRLLGVTLLTSFAPIDVEQVWNRGVGSVREEVRRLAGLAAQAGLHGVVSSPLEVDLLKREYGQDFIVVTPGIRQRDGRNGDQTRTASPRDAARRGADYLVIGRPILEAEDRLGAVKRFNAEIAEVSSVRQ